MFQSRNKCQFSGRSTNISATQGLSSLDERIGVRARKALLANFGTILFLRSREDEVDLFAATHLGTRMQTETITTLVDEGGLLSAGRGKIRRPVLVCPPGTLGRLEPHQGFAIIPGLPPCEHPLSFVPWFEERRSQAIEGSHSLDHLLDLLSRHGLREANDDRTFQAALRLCSDASRHGSALAEAKGFFLSKCALVPNGLDGLPAAWLRALPNILWSLRQPHWTHLPFMIGEFACAEGLLQVRFTQESLCPPQPDRVTAWDWLRVKINAALYPSCWRPLTAKHRRYLSARQPELPPPGAPPIN